MNVKEVIHNCSAPKHSIICIFGLHVIDKAQQCDCDCRHISLPKVLWQYAGSTPVRVSPSKTPVRPDPRHDDTPVPRRSVC